MKIIYNNEKYIVCIKPSGVLSTDEPEGMPELIRKELGLTKDDVYTVHRLDRVVAGLMVYAKDRKTASYLSSLMGGDSFRKEYLAVVHGKPEEPEGEYRDLLFRDKAENKTYVVSRMRKGVRDAALEYKLIGTENGLSLVKIHLLTGRTHQIRAQFSSRKMPLAGDRKYGAAADGCRIALWSHRLCFDGKEFIAPPPRDYPWNLFSVDTEEYIKEDIELTEREEHRKLLESSAVLQ